jgi:uncharacterized protein YyaL (SSP411 family)
VDWYPWSSEALEKARSEDKPIFLSIGYSACHWCHVMERESFEDEETARLLNEHFVSIKVDREERPDLDAVYMRAVSALTGRGGWPLNVWLTPSGAPFFGGTYFPEEPRYGMASFRQVVRALAEAWRDRRAELDEAAAGLVAGLSREQPQPPALEEPVHQAARESLDRSFDSRHGGWGEAPKFPQPMLLEYLLMRLQSGGASPTDLREQVERTLDAMACGGIYDQLRGGFHRYSTDDRWLVPHFEKMLYDNAQLARTYLHAWQLLGADLYRRVAEETLEYLAAEMRHPGGGFFSSQDADSEGQEGRFFLWTEEEVEKELEPDLASTLREAYGLTPEGNFEGGSILWMAHPPRDRETTLRLETARGRLRAVRDRRVRPGRDDKILASWNGLALAAFADAGRALNSRRFRDTSLSLGEFLAREFVGSDFAVFRSWKDGRRTGQAYLEDYACLIEGFISLYQTTFDERWFGMVRGLTESMTTRFKRDGGGFYDTSPEHEQLVVRPRSVQDSPTPCGNSLAATVLLKMAAYTGAGRYWDLAKETLSAGAPPAALAPEVFGQWLCAHHLADEGLTQVAIVGDLGRPTGMRFISAVTTPYLPSVVVAARPPGAATEIPILAMREIPDGSRAAAWVCRQQSCSTPILDPADLSARMEP